MIDTPHAAELVAVPLDSSVVLSSDLEVSAATVQLAHDGVAANTRRAYGRWWERFEQWCTSRGRTAMPATKETLAEFTGSLAAEGLAPSSVNQAISAIRTRHHLAGHPKGTPDNHLALTVLRGHQRQRAADGKGRQRKAPPITLEAFRSMISVCDPDTLLGKRDRILLILGVALMGRRSELAALEAHDVTVTEDGLLIYIRQSKTDQDAKGEEVAVPYGVHADTDPVRALRSWRDAIEHHGITDGPLLRTVRSGSGTPRGPMNGHSINAAIRRLAIAAGLPHADRYTAHSLRAGGATMAYKAGAPISAIARQGRWKDGSAVVLGYIRAVDKWRDNPMRGVL